MNLVIDEFNSNTGFAAFGNAAIVTPENEIKDFLAGPDNTKSVQFEFNTSGDYVEKTGLSISVTEFMYIVCSFYSSYNKNSKGLYTIEFDDNHIFEIDTFNYMIDQYFRLDEITTITKLKITYTGNKPDYLIVSHCVAATDELPLDIFQATKALVEKEIESTIGDGFLLGTADTIAGESTIALNQLSYTALNQIDRYAVIKIDKAGTAETHILDENNERYFRLGKLLDGPSLINTFDDANIYLTIPVRYGVNQKEYSVPSMNITGFITEAVRRGGKIENVFNTRENGEYVRLDDQIQKFIIQVSCIDRIESNIMSYMATVARNIIAREVLWVNGQRYDIYFEGVTEFEPLTESDNPIVGLIYNFSLEVKEEIWKNIKYNEAMQTNITVGSKTS